MEDASLILRDILLNKVESLTTERDSLRAEVERLKGSLAASERFRMEDGMGRINLETDNYTLRKEVERLKEECDKLYKALKSATAIIEAYDRQCYELKKVYKNFETFLKS